MSKSGLEEQFDFQLKAVGFPPADREYMFHETRKWKFDFAWPAYMLAVEVEGGIWVRGRHTRGAGFLKDCVKYNEAAILGWTVLRMPVDFIKSGEAVDFLERAFLVKGKEI